MDINFPMASSSSFSVLCINHTKVSVSEASCCGPPTFPNSSLLSSSYAVHLFTKWTSSSTSSKSHILHFLSLLGTAGRAYLPFSIARLCALVLSCARFVAFFLDKSGLIQIDANKTHEILTMNDENQTHIIRI